LRAKILWGLMSVFSILCIGSLVLLDYSRIQTLYYKGFIEPSKLPIEYLLGHQAEIEEYQQNFYLNMFQFLAQLGLYGLLCLLGITMLRRKLEP